jgi:hypothetical protein
VSRLKKILCIFEKSDSAIVEAIQDYGDVIRWEHTFGGAIRYLNGAEEELEIIIASEFASSGNDDDLIEYIERIQADVKYAKLVMILSHERVKDNAFLLKLASTGVEYHLCEDIYPEDLKKWTSIGKNDSDIQIVFAANMEELEEPLRIQKGMSIVEKVFEREAIADVVERRKPDSVIISPRLPGNSDLIDVVWSLRNSDARKIFITDTIGPEDLMIQRIRESGVEHIVFGVPKIGELEDIIRNKKVDTFQETDAEASMGRQQSMGGLISRGLNNIPTLHKPKIKGPNVSKLTLQRPRFGPGKRTPEKLNNVICCYSPVPAGKTFIATNLSMILSNMGLKVALLDLTKNMGIHTWYGIPLDENGLAKALEDPNEVLDFAISPKHFPNIAVFTQDPSLEKVSFKAKEIERVLTDLSATCDVVLIDMGLDGFSEEGTLVLKSSGSILLIGDHDYQHSVTLQIAIDELIDKDILGTTNVDPVFNGYIEGIKVPISDMEAAVQMDITWQIPDATKEVYESIRHGIPASMLSVGLKNTFMTMAEDLLEFMRGAGTYETVS